MHERSPKNKPIDVILYEIDMLRHCARTLPEKLEHFDSTQSDHSRAEYYLGIEGFLLHLRNLLGFFVRKAKGRDLSIQQPQQWASRPVERHELTDLIERANEINNRYGTERSDCYDQISKFLQHCTAKRHEEARSWAIEDMFADFDPILSEFEKRFASQTRPAEIVAVMEMDNHGHIPNF